MRIFTLVSSPFRYAYFKILKFLSIAMFFRERSWKGENLKLDADFEKN
jgi:hypothetical protein